MIVQITDYGVSVLKETARPFKLTKFIMGNQYGYVPSQTAEGIRGIEVLNGNTSEYEVVNANTVKYRIALDYQVTSFYFGEIALYDDTNTCVAICVASELVEKRYQENSVVVDIYLSMVGENYVMWADDLASSNSLTIPVVETVDVLYPTQSTLSNVYVVKPTAENKTAILAYTTKQGLWNFDVYQYKNTAVLTITDCTPTTITVDVTPYTLEELNDIIPKYFGEIIIEFSSGPLYSICRNVKTTRIIGTKAVLSFATPIASPCNVGDTVIVFGRTVLSVADSVLPIATETVLGGVIVGDGLSIDEQGILSADFPVTSVQGHTGEVELELEDFAWMHKVAKTGNYNDLKNRYTLPVATDTVLGGVKSSETGNIYIGPSGVIDLAYDPVKSVNGTVPDPETGNVQLNMSSFVSGLINAKEITEGDLNTLTTAGIYYSLAENSLDFINSPVKTLGEFSIEVVPMYEPIVVAGSVVQRLTTATEVFTRVYNGQTWSGWNKVLTEASLPIATDIALGAIRVGKGLTIDDAGILTANVTSVFGMTGDIQLNSNDLMNILKIVIDMPGGIPSLSQNPNPPEDLEEREKQEWEYSRIAQDQLPLGTLYYFGTWSPEDNVINENELIYVMDGGRIHIEEEDTIPPDEATDGENSGEEDTEDDDNIAEEERVFTENVMSGAVLKVIASGSRTIDGITEWAEGDLLVSLPVQGTALNNTWIKIRDNTILNAVKGKIDIPTDENGTITPGIVYVDNVGISSVVTSIRGGTF